ncbi:MAG: ATP-binding protein, partial [Lewinella sp.]|nr:ATP-binding protein [Lewinella sp.]
FLSLSRLEEGRMEAQPEHFHLETFCRELEEEISPLLKKEQHLLVSTEHTDTDVFTDPRFLRNIMINLISNAIKYSGEGKNIHCEARIASGEHLLTIKVIDEGIGIPSQDQQHLFTRFFRAHNVENIKGTGLGLHIVRRYVDLLGGEIDFTSSLGKGSTFVVTLPIKR